MNAGLGWKVTGGKLESQDVDWQRIVLTCVTSS